MGKGSVVKAWLMLILLGLPAQLAQQHVCQHTYTYIPIHTMCICVCINLELPLNFLGINKTNPTCQALAAGLYI